jgi:hypothetical protein
MAILFANVDWSRFKSDFDRDTVMNLVTWFSEGCVNQFSKTFKSVEVYEELDCYRLILKNVLYGPEYL